MESKQSTRLMHCSIAALAIGCVLSAASALAATTTGSLVVSATVLKSCLISSGTLAFGSYDPTASSPLQANTTVTLTCTPGTTYDIGMNAGGGSGATVTLRQLTSSGNTIGYQLYRDNAYSQNWGNTVGTDTLHATSSGTLLTNTITIYGQMPAGEAAATGVYSDTVTMTVTY